jgi:hypothetical protein
MTSHIGLLWKEGGERLSLLPSPAAHTHAMFKKKDNEKEEKKSPAPFPAPAAKTASPAPLAPVAAVSAKVCAVLQVDFAICLTFAHPTSPRTRRSAGRASTRSLKARLAPQILRCVSCAMNLILLAVLIFLFFFLLIRHILFADHGDLGPSIISAQEPAQ